MTGAAHAPTRPAAAPWLLLALLLTAASIGVQMVRDRGWAPYEPATPILWLRSGEAAERLALGYDALAADLYWMRAVVYYGGQRLSDDPAKSYDLLYPLLDLVTTLDPRFEVAYRFGAIFLTEAYPAGPGRPDLAIRLLEKGLAHEPQNWRLMEDVGFVHYWWRRDYRAAAEWFQRAGEQPDAPSWLLVLAAQTLAGGGDRASSRFLWQQILAGTEDDWTRETATLRLAQLDVLDQIDALEALAARYAAARGEAPRGWSSLIGAGLLAGAPRDPAGVLYELEPGTGRVRLSDASPLFPLPRELTDREAR